MDIYTELALLAIAYILGSIPNALIVGKLFYNVDVREHGSKNMGATNTLRVLGPKAGFSVFFLDVFKGFLLTSLFTLNIIKTDPTHFPLIVFGIVSVIGHIFPVFSNFKGGKGVACTAGFILSYAPWCFLIGLAVFSLTLFLTKYVSVSSLATILSMLISSFFVNTLNAVAIDWHFTVFCSILTVFLFVSHRKNISRLIHKSESKFSFKKKM